MEAIRVFEQESREYKLLKAAADLMTILSPNRYTYYVGETYFDYGQDWKWTTILCHRNEEGSQYDHQALYPALQEKIVWAASIEDIAAAINAYFKDKFCLDKLPQTKNGGNRK